MPRTKGREGARTDRPKTGGQLQAPKWALGRLKAARGYHWARGKSNFPAARTPLSGVRNVLSARNITGAYACRLTLDQGAKAGGSRQQGLRAGAVPGMLIRHKSSSAQKGGQAVADKKRTMWPAPRTVAKARVLCWGAPLRVT